MLLMNILPPLSLNSLYAILAHDVLDSGTLSRNLSPFEQELTLFSKRMAVLARATAILTNGAVTGR